MERDPFEGLEPAALWQHFAELVRIPRPSSREEQVQQHLIRWAESKGYQWTQDSVDNLCVEVPATPGHEQAAPVIIQSHTDIVVARDQKAPADADAELGKIPVIRATEDQDGQPVPAADGGWLYAPYTTLGADNGIGCAMGLAVCEEADAVHPPLKLLFTVDEEVGMTGASKLDAEELGIKGGTLLNLDTEDDDELTIGCAGGMDTELAWVRPLSPLEPGSIVVTLELSDLVGGHSGVEIHKGRANAIRSINRILEQAANGIDWRLISISGGDKRNAIPRSCTAVISIKDSQFEAFEQLAKSTAETLTQQFAGRDRKLDVQVSRTKTDGSAQAFGVDDSRRVCSFLLALPVGIISLDPEMTNLPETSNNLAIVETQGAKVRIICNSRSASGPGLDDVAATIRSSAHMAGVTARVTNRYPGWKPNLRSPIVELTSRLYRELFNAEPKVKAIHAGLECGVLAERIPGDVDSISFGPNIRGNHAPGERVEIASVGKSYRLLLKVLAELANTVGNG